MRYLVWNKDFAIKCPCCGVSLYSYKEDLYDDMQIFDLDNIKLMANAKFVGNDNNKIKCLNCGIERYCDRII